MRWFRETLAAAALLFLAMAGCTLDLSHAEAVSPPLNVRAYGSNRYFAASLAKTCQYAEVALAEKNILSHTRRESGRYVIECETNTRAKFDLMISPWSVKSDTCTRIFAMWGHNGKAEPGRDDALIEQILDRVETQRLEDAQKPPAAESPPAGKPAPPARRP